jgi:hypothetical protein
VATIFVIIFLPPLFFSEFFFSEFVNKTYLDLIRGKVKKTNILGNHPMVQLSAKSPIAKSPIAKATECQSTECQVQKSAKRPSANCD